MSQLLIMIATGVVAFAVGRLTAWPTIRRLHAELTNAAWWLSHDHLTGLYNRYGLLAAYATIARTATPHPIIVMLIDIDRLKAVNDTHGHDAGDDLLVTIGERIDDIAALFGGTSARLSGDEYAALLPVRDHELRRIADTFLTTIAQPVTLTVNEEPITLTPTVSVGMAVAETGDPCEAALHLADIAMYHAKRNGGNGYTVYVPGMVMPASRPRRGPRLRDLRQQRPDVIA